MECGITKKIDADTNARLCTVAEGDNFALKTSHGSTEYVDMIAYAEWSGHKLHWALRLVKHEAEHIHLLIRNHSQRTDSGFRGTTCLVGQKSMNIREFYNRTTLGFTGSHKNDC